MNYFSYCVCSRYVYVYLAINPFDLTWLDCDDASPRFCFETKLYIRLLISLINDEGSTGPPTAWPNQAIVAFDRPYPGVQYISRNCDDASPRFFVRLDSIWGFCVFGANSEGPVGSPRAWKNKRLRPVAVLIPGYNICKICDDANLSYFNRIFWISLFRHFPDSLDVGFGGSYPRPLRPAGTLLGHQTVDMTNTSDICQNCDDSSPGCLVLSSQYLQDPYWFTIQCLAKFTQLYRKWFWISLWIHMIPLLISDVLHLVPK